MEALLYINRTIAATNAGWSEAASFEDVLAYFDKKTPGWREAYHRKFGREPTPQGLAELIRAETAVASPRSSRTAASLRISLEHGPENGREALHAFGRALAMGYEPYWPRISGRSFFEGSATDEITSEPTEDERESYRSIWGISPLEG